MICAAIWGVVIIIDTIDDLSLLFSLLIERVLMSSRGGAAMAVCRNCVH